jgi:N-acyl homoserine lactone hydrolase
MVEAAVEGRAHQPARARRRVERPWLLRKLADDDPALVREGLLRMIALDHLIHIVPAHDLGAHDEIPRLTGAGG